MSNVPHPSITSTGVTAPSQADILAGLWEDFQAAFGGALNESVASPQGQLVTAMAATIGASNDLFLQYVNQIDPAFADGRMQDAIARIYYLTRIAAQPTTVTATCTGANGTLIPKGSLAVATDGTIYQSVADATIPSTGTIDTAFQAIQTGPISCPAGALSAIYRVVSGWESITNAADGIVGRDAETRAEFEARRSASVSLNATGILPAMRAAVLAAPNVVDAYVTENTAATSATIGGVSVAAHSLYVAVYGGTDADVAQAIWSRKPPGCAYTGTTTVSVTDTSYSLPYPTYSVTFQRATAVPIYMAVSIANNGLVPSNAETLIRDAITSAFSGGDGGPSQRIGGTVYALRFAAAVAAVGSWVQLVSITVGTTASPTAADVTVNIDSIPTIAAANISVTLV